MANKQTRGMWFHLIMVITIIGMGYLSLWQFHRLEWKRGIITKIEKHWGAPIVPLAELEKLPLGEWAWRRVELSTDLIPGTPPAALTETQGSQFGYRAFLRTSNLRWLIFYPWHARNWQPTEAEQSANFKKSVVAIIKPVQPTAPYATKNNPAANEWHQIDPILMQYFQPPITTHYLQILTEDAAKAGPVLPNNNHLQYALTWTALALVVAGMYAHLLWQRRKK